MSFQDVRKGMVNFKNNDSNYGFLSFEILILCSFLTWLCVTQFNWNGIATFVVSFVLSLIILFNSRLFYIFSFIFSILWGVASYLLLSFLVEYTGGGNALSIGIGVVGFILGVVISLGARLSGKEYLDDIE